MSALAVIVELRIKAGRERDGRDAIVQNASTSLKEEPGCLQFDVLVDPKDARKITLYEIYRTAADFQVHLETSHYLAFDSLAADLLDDKIVRLLDVIEGTLAVETIKA